jgi:hypothetical protein
MKPLLKYVKYFLAVLFLFLFIYLQIVKIPKYGSWGIYHYYINSKYIKELGYFNLYSCTISSVADRKIWNGDNLVRNLSTYQIVRVNDLSMCPKNNFSNLRWEAFKKDISYMMNLRSPTYWNYVLDDKGFNPPPSWAAFAGIIANLIPINSPLYFFIFNSDMLFILLASLIVYFSAGKFASLLTLSLSLIYFGTFGAIFNNYLQYLWFPCIVLAVYFWRKDKPVASGLALGVASALQAFPAIFAVPVFLFLIISWIKKRIKEVKYSSLFIFGFSIALAASILFGSIYASKVNIWSEWYQKISIQKEYLNGEMFDIGFPNLLGKILSSDHSNSYSYLGDYSHAIGRIAAFDSGRIIYYGFVGIGLLLIIYIFLKYKISDPMSYGYFLMFLLFSASPYYYLVLALIPFMFWNVSDHARKFICETTLILFFAELLLFWNIGAVSFLYIYQLISEMLIFIFFAFLLIICLLDAKKSYRL